MPSFSRPTWFRRALVLVVSLALIVIALWGARVIWLDVLRHSLSRPFGGDFPVAMSTQLANPDTVVYGPIFVIESWLHARWPEVFSITAFALANVPLVAVAFMASIYAARLSGVLALSALAGWLAINLLPIGLLDAANPELLEITFLCLAWLAASRGSRSAEGAWIGLAMMMKLVPAIFFMQLLVRRQFRGIASGMAVVIVLVATVAVGKQFDPFEAIGKTLLPFGPYSLAGSSRPFFESTAFSNLSSALGRLMLGGETTGLDRFSYAEIETFKDILHVVGATTAATLVAGASWMAFELRRSPFVRREHALTLTYGTLFAIMPMVSLAAHPHTFVFLLPVWTALPAVLAADRGPRRLAFGAAFAICYAFIGLHVLPVAIDRVLGTSLIMPWKAVEPIWPTLFLGTAMIAYGLAVARGIGAVPRATISGS